MPQPAPSFYWIIFAPIAAVGTFSLLLLGLGRTGQRPPEDAWKGSFYTNPNDPALLVSLGDALVRAQRFEDSIRNYRRAAVIAPGMGGIAAKISAAQDRMASRRAPVRPTAGAVTDKRFSNAAPETQSH